MFSWKNTLLIKRGDDTLKVSNLPINREVEPWEKSVIIICIANIEYNTSLEGPETKLLFDSAAKEEIPLPVLADYLEDTYPSNLLMPAISHIFRHGVITNGHHQPPNDKPDM